MVHRTTDRRLWALGLLVLAAPSTPAASVDFARDIQPLLSEKCVRCHGDKKQEGGLRLDVRQRAFTGGDSGAVLVPGASARSDLLHRLTSDDRKLRMPPAGARLTPEEIARVKVWIDEGARWPDDVAGSEGASKHWAFRPVRRPDMPAVRDAAWVRSPIDRFILTRLEQEGIAPAPEADRRTLIRRLYLDLLGLPPSPDDLRAALADESADWFTQLADRLLASPHFGERWGRHWLDLVRFAESDGYENDNLRPDAFRYRDWVVNALNQDMPFDRFTIEQLAGDLLPDATETQRIATGLHRNTLYNSASSADKEEFRTYAVKDRADTTFAVWTGLTFACAKCHSHKYDPIAQREYYGIYAFFNNTEHADIAVPGGKALTLRAAKRPSHVHIRGDFLQKGDAVTPGTPRFLPPLRPRGQEADRLDLAQWLVDPAQPLTARVAVNRIWQQLFGRGLVPTPDNFGTSGLPPSHPELLDWLANEFAGHWSQKQLIRAIVTSAVYRQSSRHRPELLAKDPSNSLVARQNRQRVEAEVVRDLALAASGLLAPTLGGPSIVPPRPHGLPGSGESLMQATREYRRRSIYIHVQRTLVHPVLATFDAADPNQSCASRSRSCTPMQALTLLNDANFMECARALGRRLQAASAGRDGRLRHGFELCLGREPTDAERAILVKLVDRLEQLGGGDDKVWTGVARTLLNLEQFTTRE